MISIATLWSMAGARRLAETTRRRLPALAAATAAALGLANGFSALTPHAAWRAYLLVHAGPLGAGRLLHAVALPVSAVLVVVAPYLWRRRHDAWRLALGLLVALTALNLVKGLDVEEAALSGGGALLLWWGRGAFCVRHDPVRLRSALWRVPALVLATVAVAVAAVAVVAPAEPVGRIVVEALDLLAFGSGPVGLGEDGRQLELALGALSITGLLGVAWLVFRPLAAPRSLPSAEARRAVSRLVRRHGYDTLAFFKLRGDQHYLFAPGRDAFLGYRVEAGVLLCAGDPVGDERAMPALVDEVMRFAAQRGLRVGVVSASAHAADLFEHAGLRRLYVGDEAIVDASAFSLEGRAIRKVRQSVTRLEKAGYSFSLQRLPELGPAGLDELEDVSASWRQGAAEHGFSMALDMLGGDDQEDTLVAVARDGDGRVRGFLHFVPAYGRPAVSLSFMRRDRSTPNGLTEFLVARSLEALREQGVAEVSLNFAAFARVISQPRTLAEHALRRLARAAEPYFQIESLYRFNAKFDPRWQPRYLLYERPLCLPRVGLAAAFAEGQLPRPWPARPPSRVDAA